MKSANLQGFSRRRGYVVTSQSDRQTKAVPALVWRQFIATSVNQFVDGGHELRAHLRGVLVAGRYGGCL